MLALALLFKLNENLLPRHFYPWGILSWKFCKITQIPLSDESHSLFETACAALLFSTYINNTSYHLWYTYIPQACVRGSPQPHEKALLFIFYEWAQILHFLSVT